MKQLLPSAVIAIAIHGLVFIMDVPWSKRAPVTPLELKTISVVLTREIRGEKPVPATPPAERPQMPSEREPEQMIMPAPRPPEKPIKKRTEERKSVPVKKMVPAPQPVFEAKPALPEKVVAETMAPVPGIAPVQEESKGAPASTRETPSVSDKGFPAAVPEVGRISEARPLYKKNPHPHYPDIARRRNAQGTVVILALVNEKGIVQEARVETSSGHVLLDNAAITAVKSWEFEPGRRGDIPVESYVKLPITFTLK